MHFFRQHLIKKLFYLAITVFILAGCSSTSQVYNRENPSEPSASVYTAIYYIHADNDYLYHLSDGSAVRANEQALNSALEVAENALSGEVFIFHQKSQKKRLWIFPRNQNEYYHFKNGILQHYKKYRYSSGDDILFSKEAEIFKADRSEITQPDHQTYFFYFGHEIPRDQGGHYNRSISQMEVDSETFGSGVKSFLTGDQILDLVVISTCNNATPSLAKQLLPYDNYLLASAQNLHLSYIDTDALNLLETNKSTSAYDLAHAMSSQTFDRLSKEVFTAITLSIIDLKKVQNYINELDENISIYIDDNNPDPFPDNIDCQELSFFDAEAYSNGITAFYRPAKFGRPSRFKTHSGWGCKK
ncbi:MAG TPA: hypothetical protein DCE78_08215 [Bacteroidetes bacterium]|nr:hypothetical protein [Bacteroidota bacterium]